VQHRYEWATWALRGRLCPSGLYLPGAHRLPSRPAGPTVSIPLFEVELAAFAQHAGARPTKQIVLVLDRAGWHASVRLRVPDHVHLLFLPPYSPEVEPAEHLWPLTNSVLVNRHFATIDDLEDAQAERCLALQARPDLIRSTTLLHWWPERIRKRQGPKRN
jgi:transposase